MVNRPGITRREIAERYARAPDTITRWIAHPDWPKPIGRRGRWLEYDPRQVDRVVRRLFRREGPERGGSPDDLLTIKEIAAYTGLAEQTVRADISRGRWPAADEDRDGVRLWRRAAVDSAIASRRAYRRHPST